MAWLSTGVVDVTCLVSHTLTLEQFEMGFRDFAGGKTWKVQLQTGYRGDESDPHSERAIP